MIIDIYSLSPKLTSLFLALIFRWRKYVSLLVTRGSGHCGNIM